MRRGKGWGKGWWALVGMGLRLGSGGAVEGEGLAPALGHPFALIIDGQNRSLEVPPIPVKIEGEDAVFLPLSLMRDLGAKLEWDGLTKTVTVTVDRVTARTTVGQAEAWRGEEEFTLARATQNFGGRTLVLDQFFERVLGVTMGVNIEAREIRITTPEYWCRLLQIEPAPTFRGPRVEGRINVYCPSRKLNQEIVVNYTADVDCFLQVYDVLGRAVKPLFGRDAAGQVTLAHFHPAGPIPLREFRHSGRRFGRWPLTLDSLEEEHFIMIASREEPAQDYRQLIREGRAPQSGWLITGFTLAAAPAGG